MEKLFFGGDILTMNQADFSKSTRNLAVYVKDGIIIAIDDRDKIHSRISGYCELINLHKCILMPSFIMTRGSYLKYAYSLFEDEEISLDKLIKKTDKMYLQSGITTVMEEEFGTDNEEIYRKIFSSDLLQTDIIAYADAKNVKGYELRHRKCKLVFEKPKTSSAYECNGERINMLDRIYADVILHNISVYEALKNVTINAATMCKDDRLKGSIEVGKIADMIILDNNPMNANLEDLRDIRVITTIKDGRFIE
ncbi:MAG: amidohydrolase family protein [Lachnospiraceae bacterium]|nr:amidohydrolase family protein [Lachnospiraceae bacterium]